MEVTDSYIRLLIGVLVLLIAQVDNSYFAHKADTPFPRIVPDRLQFFEYDIFTVNCEVDAFTKWRVMRHLNQTISTNSSNCNTSAPSCSIDPAFKKDSGEYWCENEEGQRSNNVNITVTAGSVILESPAHPVMEGHDVILHCRNRKTQSQHIADFYKDRSHLGTLYNKNLTIKNVSKSDEGFYKCSISGAGESPKSWLIVVKQNDSDLIPENTHIHSPDLVTLLWIVVTALMVALLLLLVGRRLCRKQRVSGENSATEPHHATYAVFSKRRKNKDSGGENAVDTDVTYASVKKQQKKKGPEARTENTSLTDNSVIYSLVTF